MDGSTTEWVSAEPAPPLRPYVEGYQGYRLTGFPPGLHRGLPSRHLTFIVAIGHEIDVVAQVDPRQAPGRHRCVVAGLQDSTALIAHHGHQEGVAVALTPLGARELFGLPASALWSTSVELTDLIGPSGLELWERVQRPAPWRERFAVFDEILTRVARTAIVAPELRFSWDTLVRSGGSVTVADLATETGWTRQHLTRRFRDEFGLSPKRAGRIVRFERARRLLQARPPFVSMAQVAAATGYADQSHLNRDFADLAGCTPTQLVAEDLPFVQDPADHVGASSPT